MYLAMLTYQYIDITQKPAGIPNAWPAKVVELDYPELPDGLLASDGWVIMGDADFNAYKAQHQSEFDTWYASHTAPTAKQIVTGKILSAKEFGENLLVEIAADNVLAGASQNQIITLITNNLSLILALKSGSLYSALTMVASYTPDSLMTQARLNKYTAEIKAYLGL